MMSTSQNKTPRTLRRTGAFFVLAVGLSVSAWLIFGESVPTERNTALGAMNRVRVERSGEWNNRVSTKPIESLTVGERVLAKNPLVRQEDRAAWAEPKFEDWLLLSLKMPLNPSDERDDTELQFIDIQLLRPESWLLENYGFLFESPDDDALTAPADWSLGHSSTPLRPALGEIALTLKAIQACGVEVIGLTVDLDLPEMGASGLAFVTGIAPAPRVLEGDGQIVTATFRHPSTHVILDVRFSGSPDTLGVTENHLFWSEDRQVFEQIGKLELGERVRTFQGDTKRIESKLPRPGPAIVFNLEVYGEHVYFVGPEGILVHNSYNGQGVSKSRYKQLRSASPSPEIRQMVNPPTRVGPHADPALGRNFVDDVLEADHIVSLKEITRMPGFNRLTFDQQKAVANFPRNFIGLVKQSNSSKGARNWAQWWGHKKSGTPVSAAFRRKMLKKERKVRGQLQMMINDLLKANG